MLGFERKFWFCHSGPCNVFQCFGTGCRNEGSLSELSGFCVGLVGRPKNLVAVVEGVLVWAVLVGKKVDPSWKAR